VGKSGTITAPRPWAARDDPERWPPLGHHDLGAGEKHVEPKALSGPLILAHDPQERAGGRQVVVVGRTVDRPPLGQ
jgi:hypothetical protein